MEHHRYVTPETAANTLLPQLSPDSRIVVTGQIGCGKTTLSEEISTRLRLTHLHIDDFGDDENSLQSAAAIKITFPRRVASGNIGDSDVYGAQQHAPLYEIEIPWA